MTEPLAPPAPESAARSGTQGMRVLSIVTLFSPDGAYGGPTRVALNQAAALRDVGCQVELAGAARGYRDGPPATVAGAPVRTFRAVRLLPRTGFAGLSSPGMLRWVRAACRSADVVHVHLARDLVTLLAAAVVRRSGVPYVVQTHGMIDPSRNPLARPLDALLTRRVLRGASAVLHLTARERSDLESVAGPGLPFVELVNGVPLPPAREPASGTEVLFLARLHSRKRPTTFVRAAQILASEFEQVRFTLVGPDEGEGPAVRELLAADDGHGRITWTGPLAPELTSERLGRASVYALPSVNEPFPMSVLEAMAEGVPVVVTDTCGLAERIGAAGAGLVIGDSVDQLTDAVRRLLVDPDLAHATGDAGLRLCREELSMAAVAERLVEIYRAAGTAR